MTKSRFAAPIVAAALLLLPAMYVGSYLALVVPEGIYTPPDAQGWRTFIGHYRWFPATMPKVFWPLETIDQALRPDAWPQPVVHPPR